MNITINTIFGGMEAGRGKARVLWVSGPHCERRPLGEYDRESAIIVRSASIRVDNAQQSAAASRRRPSTRCRAIEASTED